MIIQVEGVDGSGKSSLVKHIGELLDKLEFEFDLEGEKQIPTKPEDPNRVTETVLYDKLCAMAEDKVIYVLDRGPFSDIIYRVFDNHTSVTDLGKLSDWFREQQVCDNAICIYCNTNTARERMIARGEDNPTSLIYHNQLKKLYDAIFQPMLLAPWYYNIEHDPDYSMVDEYIKLCVEHNHCLKRGGNENA